MPSVRARSEPAAVRAGSLPSGGSTMSEVRPSVRPPGCHQSAFSCRSRSRPIGGVALGQVRGLLGRRQHRLAGQGRGPFERRRTAVLPVTVQVGRAPGRAGRLRFLRRCRDGDSEQEADEQRPTHGATPRFPGLPIADYRRAWRRAPVEAALGAAARHNEGRDARERPERRMRMALSPDLIGFVKESLERGCRAPISRRR